MIVDVHIHFLSPHAIEAARKAPERYGVRVLDHGPRLSLQIGGEPPTRPLLEPLYTIDRHLAFLTAQGIDRAVFGPLMDVGGYSLAPDTGAAWSRLQNEALAASLAEAGGRHRGLAAVPAATLYGYDVTPAMIAHSRQLNNKYTEDDWRWLLAKAGLVIRQEAQLRPSHRIFVTTSGP